MTRDPAYPLRHLLDGAGPSPGTGGVNDGILRLITDELLAECRAYRPRGVLSIDTTAAVRKVFSRLLGDRAMTFPVRARFLRLASRAMRSVMVDCATRYLDESDPSDRAGNPATEKPGAAKGVLVFDPQRARLMIEFDRAIAALEDEQERLARTAECWFFGGMTRSEIAEALSSDKETVRSELALAQVRLHQAMLHSDLHTHGRRGR